MKKTLKSCFALALALVLCLGLCATAFADADYVDAKAAITKELTMPAKTPTPNCTFKFVVTSVSVDGDTTVTAPVATIADISFTGTDAGTDAEAGGVKSVVKESNVQFGTFPHAGLYVYNVKETENTVTANKDQTFTYSKAEYEMQVFVANKPGAEGGLYIQSIVVYQTKDDAGNDISVANQTKEPNIKPTENGTGNSFRFVNKYVQKSGSPDPNNTTFNSLKVEKKVTGNLGDLTKEFSFSLTVNKTAFEADNTTYNYVKYKADGTEVANGAGTLTAGTASTITLAHGEYIIVKDLLVGATYTVTETDTDKNYTTTIVAEEKDTVNNNSKTASGTLRVLGNTAEFTNKYDLTPPTGIVINSLPYVILVVAAMTGIVLFVVSRKRREQED